LAAGTDSESPDLRLRTRVRLFQAFCWLISLEGRLLT